MGVESSRLIRLSTDAVAPRERLSYGSWLVGCACTPSALSAEAPLEYQLDLTALQLPELSILAQRGSPQRAMRTAAEIRRTQEHCFNLVLVLGGSWRVTHQRSLRYGAGDLIFYDSRYPLDCDLRADWSNLNLQLSEAFVRRWIARPSALCGRHIARDSRWGRVLSSYVAQLSPDFVVQAPLPESLLVDQLGALLALTAAELGGGAGERTVERSLRDRIFDLVRQRCQESSLQAGDIAASLQISKRTLHRALAGCGETFGSLLLRGRVEVAVRLLESPLFARLTTAEIGRRAGFSDASHFTRVLRRRTGCTPRQLRRALRS